MNLQEKYIQRSIQLAELGLSHVAPNPLVGCVIVNEDKVVGEGYHQQFGQAHAEVNAINSVRNASLLKSSTLYVNLEPCSHYGKTPPCADLIIAKQIPKVVIGCTDTFIEVSGKGIKKMREAGIDVVTNILEAESLELNKRFFTYHNKKRPFVILKWAESTDGYIASESDNVDNGDSRRIQWISNMQSRKLVHKWRSEEQAIMVGTNTALKDNPMLSVRMWNGKNPVRIVLDRNLRLSDAIHLFNGEIPTVVFTTMDKKSGGNLQFIKIKFDEVLDDVMQHLYRMQIQSVIIEGGSQLLKSFIEKNLWDEARIFTNDRLLIHGIKAPFIKGVSIVKQKIGNDQLNIVRN